MDNLRDIPGYNGRYKATDMGEIRSYWWRNRPMKNGKYRVLVPYRRANHKSNRRYVKLTGLDGIAKEVAVLNIMVNTWTAGRPPGKVAYHKNGNLSDNSLYNIAFAARRDLGRKTGGDSRRRPCARITRTGEVVAHYSSVRDAARHCYMSYQTILDRCHDRVKKPYALDGTTFIFDD